MNRIKTYSLYGIAILFVLTSCKKDLFEILFPKNKSFVECMVNGERAYGEGLRGPFEPYVNFHMNYYYNKKDTFTFNIEKYIFLEDNKRYLISLSVCRKSLPAIGEKMYFSKNVYSNKDYMFEDNSFIAAIESYPYLYECTDTLKLPESIRKKRLSIRTTKATDGYIEFTKLDIVNGHIYGKFEFAAEATSEIIDGVIIASSVKQGHFEGYHLECDKTFYQAGLPEIIF
ncbi:hypothetical protein [Bacteroides neonati]|uniref:hypothetical protein n=1 Tax=Bacteroides neonati TaxID=1347393 RepID=UPI0004B174DF|nr:hypothetical protein [Bacteroides neonati]